MVKERWFRERARGSGKLTHPSSEARNTVPGTGYSASGPCQKAISTLIVDNLVKAEKALERIAKLISVAGIIIYYFYSTTSTGKMASCVIRTADDRKAIKILHKG